MTTEQQIIAFFDPERRKLHNLSEIERIAGIPRDSLRHPVYNVKYRHMTDEQIEKLLPVLKKIGFKLKK